MEKLTIADLLNSLTSPESSDSEKYTAKEIWQMIADKKSFEEMGFDSEEDLKKFISDNEYDNI
jgi:hypothetical protein